MSVFDPDAMRKLDKWTPIASRSRLPVRRERQEKRGKTRAVLYAHAWEPVDGAPLTIDVACELAETASWQNACAMRATAKRSSCVV
jgi:hypothetical protein